MKIKPIGPKSHPGWRKCLPHYQIECERHGRIWSYESGHHHEVGCPICKVMAWEVKS